MESGFGALLDLLVLELKEHPVNTNRFFVAFREQVLAPAQLQAWLGHYHFFCKHFVKVLEGLLYRTPVDELDMRVELAKTLHSELGNGCSEHAHIRLLVRFAAATGLMPSELARTTPIPEVERYLQVLQQRFVESDYLTALGSELAVEVTAAAEFQYFYPGLTKYRIFSAEDLAFFALHLEAEDSHSAWLTEAVRKTARSDADLERVAAGARATAEAWQQFWEGLYREVFVGAPASAV